MRASLWQRKDGAGGGVEETHALFSKKSNKRKSNEPGLELEQHQARAKPAVGGRGDRIPADISKAPAAEKTGGGKAGGGDAELEQSRAKIQELERQLEELQRREAAVEERQRAEQLRHQREAEQAKLVTKFMRERFADEATARSCLKQVDWDFAAAVALYMPPVPDSPMSGRSFDKTSFKGGYDKATVPKGQLQLGAVLVTMIQGYCAKHGIPYEEDEGERFFEQLQAEALANPGDPIDVMAQRILLLSQITLAYKRTQYFSIASIALPECDSGRMCLAKGRMCLALLRLPVTSGFRKPHEMLL